jgi:hypothetical protein
MNVKQAIQSSANVIRVTSVSAGDVYKRFDDSYDDRVYYGVVQSVHNDGETAIIEALEYSYRYSSLDINLKVLRGDKEYKLFPSSPEELNTELDDVVENKTREINTKTEEISKLAKELEEIGKLISGEKLKDLQAMSYKELTQTQYEAKKLEAGI